MCDSDASAFVGFRRLVPVRVPTLFVTRSSASSFAYAQFAAALTVCVAILRCHEWFGKECARQTRSLLSSWLNLGATLSALPRSTCVEPLNACMRFVKKLRAWSPPERRRWRTSVLLELSWPCLEEQTKKAYIPINWKLVIFESQPNYHEACTLEPSNAQYCVECATYGRQQLLIICHMPRQRFSCAGLSATLSFRIAAGPAMTSTQMGLPETVAQTTKRSGLALNFLMLD